jgi:hypothetical protein
MPTTHISLTKNAGAGEALGRCLLAGGPRPSMSVFLGAMQAVNPESYHEPCRMSMKQPSSMMLNGA